MLLAEVYRGLSWTLEVTTMSSTLKRALIVREAIAGRSADIYDLPRDRKSVVYTRDELEALLDHEMDGMLLYGAIKTRSKLAKQAVCEVLGYRIPGSFKRVRPRIAGQDLEVHVQQRDNLQVYNAELVATCRHAILRVDDLGRVRGVRVALGAELAALDKTGVLTSKYQAKRLPCEGRSTLVSLTDTPAFVDELAPVDHIDKRRLARAHPVSAPVRGSVLTVQALYKSLQSLVGCKLEFSSSERVRGERLQRLVCKDLGLPSYADTGRFPDIVCQALEVKLQTSPTIDLGKVTPDSLDPAPALSPRLRHCDARHLVAYATREGDSLRISSIVVSTGVDFFSEFKRTGGLVQNRKRQLKLPKDFFQPE